MEKESTAAPTGGFKIPVELLKTFQSDVRFIPPNLHVYGYIMFDGAMLKSILLSGNEESRRHLAQQLDKLYEAGGELVIMTKAESVAE